MAWLGVARMGGDHSVAAFNRLVEAVDRYVLKAGITAWTEIRLAAGWIPSAAHQQQAQGEPVQHRGAANGLAQVPHCHQLPARLGGGVVSRVAAAAAAALSRLAAFSNRLPRYLPQSG